MCFNYFHAIIILFLFSSCTTMRSRQLERVQEDNAVTRVSATINSLCFQDKNPQFLADINSSNFRVPSFQLEAIWENSFAQLKGSVVGPLGEEYSSFEVKGNKIDYTFHSESVSDNDALNQMTSVFAKIGSKNLRKFLCGSYAFEKLNEVDGIFTEVKTVDGNSFNSEINLAPISNKRQFITISTLVIDNNEVEVQSNLSLERKGLGYSLVMNSQFYYGPFSKESDVRVRWAGYALADNVYPTELTFKIGTDIYTINVTEYQ
ncbi:hypothetical protein [Fluviispira multicolorata]|uniref:Uncharacterized protein n=1 Tax=Fluviispira multicolorata TaxID=2654512 RepID=A0A833JAT2_9BACT|nr:hypothetical protein [Fluviispira multicolorata]KAB8028139.1 hypothetical protein GCL57_13910 [Fluviispira multicolorata]